MYPRMRKIRGMIQYPEYLDMSDYLDQQYAKDELNQKSLY